MKELLEKYRPVLKNNSWLFVFLLYIPFINDSYSSFKLLPDWLMDYVKILVLLLLITLFAINKKKVSKLNLCLITIESWWLTTTLINYGLSDETALHKTIIDIVNALAVAGIIEFFKEDPDGLLKGMMLNFELALYPNFVTVILNHAERGYYLLGYYAVLILWILPAICVAALYMFRFKKYLRGSVLIIISLATAVITWCATIIVALMGMAASVLLGVLLLKSEKTRKYRIPLSVLLLLSLLGNVFVLFVYNGGSFPFIDFFIQKVLGRSTTFTNRVRIWQEAMRMISEKPIIGYGYRPEILIEGWNVVIHAHNQILQRLTATGIIGLVLFVVFHVVLCLKTDKEENSVSKIVMDGAAFAVSITYLMDAYKKFFRFYIVFFLAYHAEELLAEKLAKNDELLK